MHYINNHSYWRARPTERDFSFDIISHHPETDGKIIKKYNLDGIDSVGVFGDEKFEIHLHNKSFEDVSAKISIDGTCVLGGKEADLDPNDNTWLVRAGKTLHLKAWHETNAGGAALVFTSGDKSVALHTHGNTSHKGIISVAIFAERDQKPASLHSFRFNSSAPIPMGGSASSSPQTYSSNNIRIGGQQVNSSHSDSRKRRAAQPTPIGEAASSMDYMEVDRERSVSVGAGEYTIQKTSTVKGLDNPVLHSILRARYLWWDELQAKIKTQPPQEDGFPTGFPAAKIKTFADLSNVPRVVSAGARTENAATTTERVSTGIEGIYARTV